MVSEIWGAADRILCHFGQFFALLPSDDKILEKWKNTWRYYHFTHVYHTWQSYDVWFLRYGAWRTIFFVILDRFLLFYPPNNPKNKTFEKVKKKNLAMSSFYTNVPKIMIICYTIPEIQCMTDVILIFYFGLFFTLLPT